MFLWRTLTDASAGGKGEAEGSDDSQVYSLALTNVGEVSH